MNFKLTPFLGGDILRLGGLAGLIFKSLLFILLFLLGVVVVLVVLGCVFYFLGGFCFGFFCLFWYLIFWQWIVSQAFKLRHL